MKRAPVGFPRKIFLKHFLFISFSITILVALPFSGAAADSTHTVLNPHVSTDKSIDCSSLDRILKGLIKKDMTDEQKVLAVFHWIRRVLYHGDGPEELAFDFHKMINVMGNGSCLRQTTPLSVLLSRLGYESESWTHDGHHMIQVKYGGRWHCLDPHMNFYVYDRSDPPEIAGIEELRADSTLAFDAVRENRAGPGYLLCGDRPGFFTGRGEWIKEQFSGRPWPEMRIEEPFGKITLRRGESYIRTWMPGPHYFKGAWQFDSGPCHTCGPRDREDQVNWPLYEPHPAMIGNITAYRHWGAGRLVYQPDLHSDHYLDAVVSKNNIRHDKEKGLASADSSKPAEVIFSVDCPYVITAGSLALEKTGDGRVSVSVSTDQGESWKRVEVIEKGAGLSANFIDQVNGSFEGYQLKLAIESKASVSALVLESYFQLNPYSLPYLVPGLNLVRLNGMRFDSPLKVEWAYAESPDWKQTRTASWTFKRPGTFAIQVNGDRYPRNVSLTLGVAP
ncbi:MAG TPA: hypothetical protein VM123_18205 [archaeon]|nr:hypothetical protein [archaeon]